MGGISTHILDTSLGRPASGVAVHLESAGDGGVWHRIGSQRTDQDGRCRELLPESASLTAGRYRLCFETGPYYEAHAMRGLYPIVEITFNVLDSDRHLHIPLLLTANGYTTYRGT